LLVGPVAAVGTVVVDGVVNISIDVG